MRKRTRPRIGHDQRCRCPRPLPSGRHHMGWELCRLCRHFIVRSGVVRAALEAEERRAEELEKKRESPA